jgi:UDP-N-acetyl-D-glucosamine dehydrogenase
MPHFVVEKIQNALNDATRPLRGSRVHVLGVAYKRDIDDVRESPALDIIHLLTSRGAIVSYSDPYVPSVRIGGGQELTSVPVHEGVEAADCTVIVTNHAAFDYADVVKTARVLVDTRNALKSFSSDNIVRL